MGMIEYLLLRDRVDDLANRVAGVHAESQARIETSLDAVSEEVEVLRTDLEELALYTRALSSLLVEAGLIRQDELVRRIEELDAEDGARDGRLS